MILWNDVINGVFEFSGGLSTLLNIRAIRKDKTIQGVHWSTYAFFTTWGIWNLFYYPSLNQWFSFSGGVLIVLGNLIWLGHALYYLRNRNVIS